MHGTLRDMLKGYPGAEDAVMGLDASLRQRQDFAIARHPDQPGANRIALGFSSAELAAVVRNDSCHRANQGPASEQHDDGLGDHAGSPEA